MERILVPMVLLSLKLALTMLAPLAMSLYVARLVAQQGDLVFSGYSIVAFTTTALFIVVSSFLQVLYFLCGRALGRCDPAGYQACIQAGFRSALATGLVASFICALAAPLLSTLGFDPELSSIVRWQGPAAALGCVPLLTLVVYRVHASLQGRANYIAVLAVAGALAGGLAAKAVVELGVGDPESVAVSVLLALSAINWIMLVAAWIGLRSLGKDAPGRTATDTTKPSRPWRDLWYYGWPIGAVVLMDSAFRLSSTLAMGRWWIDTLPVHSAIVLWQAAALVIPLGIAQASVQMVAIANARGDVALRNRVAWIALALGASYGILGALVLNVFAVQAGTLLLPGADLQSQTKAQLAELMVPGGVVLAAEGMLVIAAAVQRGVGITRALLLQALVGYALFGTGGQYLFASELGQGAAGLWWGMALGFSVAACAVTIHCFRNFGVGTSRAA